MTSISSATQTSYCAVSSAVFTTSSTSITPYTTTYTGDLSYNYFYGNSYYANSFTGGNSLVHLDGTPRVFFDSESFTYNGDACKEHLNAYASGVLSAATSEMTVSGALSSQSSYVSSTLG